MGTEMTPATKADGEIVRGGSEEMRSMTQAMSSAAVESVRAAYTIAKQFPRDEDAARQKVIRVCKSPAFCAGNNAMYRFPIGGKEITGLSINVAKEMARAMGNMRYGQYIINDTEDSRTIRCWAMDLESNVPNEMDATFRKVVWRKNKGGDGGYWKTCDEREVLMLTNSHASKAIRNCLLNLMPFDIKEAAAEMIEETIRNKAATDPAAFLRDLKDGFAELNVRPDELRDYCTAYNVDLEKLSAKWLAHMQTVLSGMHEGATWTEFLNKAAEKKGVGAVVTASDLAGKVAAKAAEAAKKAQESAAKEPAKEEAVETKKEPANDNPDADPVTPAKQPAPTKPNKPKPTPVSDPSDGIV